MENMFIGGFVLSNVGRMRILVAQIHVLHHLMDDVFFLEVFPSWINWHSMVRGNWMWTFAKVVDHISQHGAFYLQLLDLSLLLDSGIHDHNIPRDVLVLIFMDFSGYWKNWGSIAIDRFLMSLEHPTKFLCIYTLIIGDWFPINRKQCCKS